MSRTSSLEDLRELRFLWPLRGRRAVVAVCRDDASAWEPLRPDLAREDAVLVLEPEPGPVSERAGRPAIVVTDRWQEVVSVTAGSTPDEVLAIVRWLGTCCDECPQAMLEPGGEGWRSAPLAHDVP